MKKVVFHSLIALSLLTLFVSCDKGSGGRRTLLPNVTGSAGEVVVVVSGSVINESIGNLYKEILQEEYPMLPQSEPLFSVAMVPTSNFTDIFKTHRNIIITKVDDQFKEPQIVTQRDVWAAPQIVINIVGPTYPAIERMLANEKDRLIQLLEQAERDRVIQNAKKFEAEGIRHLVEKKFDITMNFPKGYALNLDTTDFMWLSYETPHTSQGVFIYEYPYTDDSTFTVDYLIEKRNDFLKRFVPGPTPGSYMITETIIPPTFNSLMFKGRYFAQIRGLWDVHQHPMGGPFVSLTTVDEERNKVITVDGYVYAPRLNKRNYIRQVEAILQTINPLPVKQQD
ncbi:MAG: DUF4837 family protein [Tenuifilaceae bacterium]|jgi:hypothetical protein|nr:DUF4837 family protein [Tenuifilaceae bacterium]